MRFHPLPANIGFFSPVALIATFFGSGLIRPASGTWGSLAAFGVGLVVLDAPAATSKTSWPETVSIPYASLVLGTKPGEASVFVYTPEDKKVHRRAVRFTPVQEGDSARVLAGLKPGETVVAAGGGWLTDGQPVTPLEATTQLTKR